MRKAEIKAFEIDKIKQEQLLQDSPINFESLENQKFKDSDILLGFGLIFCEGRNDLFHLQERKLAEVNNVQYGFKQNDIDEIFNDNRLDKIESILTYLNQTEALAREYQRTGKWYEEQSKKIKNYITNQLQEYKVNNPNWENQERVFSNDELERLYAIEEKFIDAPKTEWRVFQQNGETFHEEL